MLGWPGGADGDPAHLAGSDVGADLEAEGVAVEGQGGVRVVVREEARVNGDVHGGHASCGSVTGASRFLTGLVTCFATHGGIPAVARAASAPVGAGRHAGQFGEASAEGAQRRAADRETDLGDAEVATAQQCHRALDPPRHQVAVRRFAVGEPELAAEVPGRHVRAAGERLDVQRLRVLPVDPVPDAAQPREVAQVLLRGGSAGHTQDRTSRRNRCRAPCRGRARGLRPRLDAGSVARTAYDRLSSSRKREHGLPRELLSSRSHVQATLGTARPEARVRPLIARPWLA